MELVGSRFGHIRIVDVLGEGGMGSVYVGFDEKLQRRVAVKALHRERRLDKVARARLMREAQSLSQLDHPNICRIFDYIEDQDVDLLVLELIEGKTLQKAFADGISRAEKIRIAIDVANVLEVAHRRNIIHRDLKPDNIMLTDAGEVKVLDFGLARWLDQPQAAAPVVQTKAEEDDEFGWAFLDAAESDSGRKTAILDYGIERTQDVAATAAGITLGTPLYMSPEQARGEHLTPASDMYSFGLLLQTLFTERDPYPMDILGSEVMKRAARGESLPMTGDHAITALVNRLKQLAPTDRPTAHETVARLQSIADAPRRMWQRAIAAAVVAIVVLAAWKYTIDLRRERAAAVAAQHEAERRRAEADDLIGFMLGDLRTKLEPVGRLDALDGAASKALQYLGARKKEQLSTDELLQHSKALNQLGDVRIVQGKVPAAMALFQQSLDLTSTAARREPNNDEAQFALALSHFWIGNGYRRQNKVAEALPEIREYLRLTHTLAQRHPTNEKYVLEEGYAHSLFGLLLEAQNDLRPALHEYQLTLEIKKAMAARHPGDLEAAADVARTVNKIGVVQQKLGDLSGAREQFESEISIYEKALAAQPRQSLWKMRVAMSHMFLALVLQDMGNVAAALAQIDTSSRINAELCAIDPMNADWHRNLANASVRHADLILVTQPGVDVIPELRSAEADFRRLLSGDPHRAQWRDDLALAELVHARALLGRGNIAGARDHVAEAIRTVTPADSIPLKLRLVTAKIVEGEVLQRAGQPAAAHEAWGTARESLQALVPRTTTDPRQLDLWTRVLIHLGDRTAATPLVTDLRTHGYRNPDFESLSYSERY